MADMPLVGEEFAGYRLVEVLGRGGMGIVFRAENPRLGNVIALKVLEARLAANDVSRARFLEESRIAAALNHPNVIPIHDMGAADGLLYIAMRCVSGTDLRQILKKRGQLPAGPAVYLLGQAAKALDAAHRRSLVHRDVKPANLLVELGQDGTDPDHVYLTDFGISKHLRQRTGLTPTGELLGTIDYLAPEQIRDFPVTAQADQYALGCVLYECLTGHVPFEKDFGTSVMWAHVEEPPVQPTAHRPDLPPAIDEVFLRVLAKDPADRYGTCREFIAAARRALGAAAEPRPASGSLHLLLPSPVPGPDPAGWPELNELPSPELAGYPAEVNHEGPGAYRDPAARWPGASRDDGWPGAGSPEATEEWPDEGQWPDAGQWPDEGQWAAHEQWPGADEPAAAQPAAGPTQLEPEPEPRAAAGPRLAADPPVPADPWDSGWRPGPRRRRGHGWLIALAALVVVALALAGVKLGLGSGHGRPTAAASTKAAAQSAGGASPAMSASTAMSASPGAKASPAMSAKSAMSASPGATMAAGAAECTNEQPGDGNNGPAALAAVLADANGCSVPAHLIPTAKCRQQAAPSGEQVVSCASPTPQISQVTFRTYPTLAALYAAYTSSVSSLDPAGSFQQNTSASCGDTGANYAEAGWNHQEVHPRQFTVAEMAAGKVAQLDAMGRLACFASGKSEDLVWTTGVGKMLAVATGTGSPAAVYNWWAAIHHVIIFPGTEMCGMSGRMTSVPLGNLIQEPVCPAGAGL